MPYLIDLECRALVTAHKVSALMWQPRNRQVFLLACARWCAYRHGNCWRRAPRNKSE